MDEMFGLAVDVINYTRVRLVKHLVNLEPVRLNQSANIVIHERHVTVGSSLGPVRRLRIVVIDILLSILELKIIF